MVYKYEIGYRTRIGTGTSTDNPYQTTQAKLSASTATQTSDFDTRSQVACWYITGTPPTI